MTTVRMALLALLVLAAGCSPAPTLGLPHPAAERTPGPVASFPTPGASAKAGPSDLQALLPSTFDGIPAHTFDVGAELMARLATELGAPTEAVVVAYASEHGPEFIQMMAIRVDGTSAEDVLAAFPLAAYPPGLDAEVEAAEQQVAGRPVLVVSEPISSLQVGTFYALIVDEAVVVAQAFDRAIVERALSSVP